MERVRVRPRCDRPSYTNASSISGGIFGQEHVFYSNAPHYDDHDNGSDFLSRVAQAEARDAKRHTPPRAVGAGPSSIVFGDDSNTNPYACRDNRNLTASSSADYATIRQNVTAAARYERDCL